MKTIQRWSIGLLACIVLLGFTLRVHNHTVWPREGATFDEYAWTWLGVNLLTTGVPVSWSPHPQYKERMHYVSPKGARFWLVRPYLEHPPVFGILAGAYSIARGATDMYSVSFENMRELALILGTASIVLVYVFAAGMYGNPVGLMAALFYAVAPTTVIGSRILQNENFFIPVLLTMLILIRKYIDGGKRSFFYIAALMGGIVALAKVPWIAASVSVAGILLYKKQWKDAIMFCAIALLIFSTYIVYGMYWDKELFFSLWGLQLNRYDMSFASIFALVQQPYLVDRYFLDGWIYAGWFTWLFLFVGDIKKHAYLVFGLLGYLLIYILAIPNEPGHGWYRYPFYPFLFVSLAVFLYEYREKFAASSLVLMGIMLSLLSHTWGLVFGFSYSAYRFVVLWFGLGILPEWFPTRRLRSLAKTNGVVQITVLILLSIWTVIRYNEQ